MVLVHSLMVLASYACVMIASEENRWRERVEKRIKGEDRYIVMLLHLTADTHRRILGRGN